ncbi:hypothetical protein NYR02_11125 [Thalassolituus sp. 59MF3M-4]|uniref:Uncharacterized protein n=2 Tax=Thalassolituus pacificus TaxID=2975440 RepID=A0A9X2WGZ5_9GAMM|nr:hypothetical protein [Thalassolituus pacificus]
MPINWEQLDSDIDTAIANGATATDDKLASGISSITRMTDDEIKELFPESADAKKLSDLMKIVKSSEERSAKITKIVSNAEEFGGVVLTLLQKFV